MLVPRLPSVHRLVLEVDGAAADEADSHVVEFGAGDREYFG